MNIINKITNKKHQLFHFLGILALLSFSSCKQELDINENPNELVNVPTKTILTSSMVSLGYTLGGEATRMPATVVQYYAGHRGQPLEYAQYDISPSSTDGLWTNLYDVLMDLRTVQTKSEASGDKIYLGISQLLQAYTFSVTTDIFGDIPFSEALELSSNITPAYDKQEIIYPELIKMIDLGIANVKSASGAAPSSDDIIYAGDITKWVRFGNSLKLRLYNHIAKKDANAAKNFLDTNPLLIEDNAYNAKIIFGNTSASANPIYQFDVLSGRKDNAIANTIVDKLKALNDPRLYVYFKKVQNNGAGLAGQYLGNIPGDDTDDSGENLYSRVGSAYGSINSPVYLISSAEINFIKSEVYFRNSDTSNSKIAFENAISQDFNALGVSDVSSYLTNPSVSYDGTLARIMEQKWITMFQAAFESWVDWRRTSLPILTPPSVNKTNDAIPRRLPYPQIEINVNGNSLSQGPGIPIPYESMKVKMWWDK